jgi:hypothetical protein
MEYLIYYLISIVTVGLFTVKVFPRKRHFLWMLNIAGKIIPNLKEDQQTNEGEIENESSLKVYYAFKILFWPMAWVFLAIAFIIFIGFIIIASLFKLLGGVVKPKDDSRSKK